MPTGLVRFVVPGTSSKFQCGGLSVELQTARLVAGHCSTELVTYRERCPDHPFLEDCLRSETPDPTVLWIVSWGFDVPQLIQRLRRHRVAYHAHSSGYGFGLPPGLPVLAVSRNTLGYWGDRAPHNPMYLVPNALGERWLEHGARASSDPRPIDVLVQARKTSRYVLDELVPSLRQIGLTVEVQRGWVDDLVDLFNRSTVYLYDSADYWRGRGVSEGFGLPPLEAMACGCVVFSSLNHALADHCDPGRMVHQIGCGRLLFDQRRVQAAVSDPVAWRPPVGELNMLLRSSSSEELLPRWVNALTQLDALYSIEGPLLRSPPAWQLQLQQRFQRIRRVVNRFPGWPSS